MGILKRIHVNQHAIRAREQQPLRVKTSRENTLASEIAILDAEGTEVAVVKYMPDKPLSCGARVWIETRADLRVR